MSQHDYFLDNASGAAFRADLNSALAAIKSLNSGASAPSSTGAYMLWADTTNGLLKIRNAADSAWITIGKLASEYLGLVAGSRVMGADCKNNSTTPNTQFDLDADVVVLRDSSDGSVVRHNPGAAITNNISTAGPAANGRDQSGAFTSSSWIHFYWIWNGSTLATLSSLTAPPTGPTLPSGYTHWAYAGAIYLDGSGNLLRARIKGAWAHYDGLQLVLSSGTATSETGVSIASAIPPNALAWRGMARLVNNGGADAVAYTLGLRVVSGSNTALEIRADRPANEGADVIQDVVFELPNVSQQFYYLVTRTVGTTGTGPSSVWVMGYKLPNGAE